MSAAAMPAHTPSALSRWIGANRIFAYALMISVGVHAALLTVRFVAPEVFNLRAEDPGLEVVLLNTKSERAPSKAEVLAQVAFEGGGDKDAGQASSPLPNVGYAREGDSLQEQRKRLEQLESEQQKLLASVRDGKRSVDPIVDRKALEDRLDPTAEDIVDSARALAQQAAIINDRIEAENKRPKKYFFGTSAKDYAAAMYVDAFRTKVERWGNLNYPIEARGRLYGQVQLTVVIDKDGQIRELDVTRTSGNRVLDMAALNIVRRAAPYGKFTKQMKSEMDLLSITRTMIFTNDAIETRSR